MEQIAASKPASNEHWTKIITSKHNLFDLRLREVYQYRDLIRMFIKRDFVVQYKQTILGPLWYLVQPLLSSIMYIFVFGQLANIGTDGVPPLLFYFGGTMLWTYFTACLLSASNVFLANKDIFSKVYFPRLTVPISTTVGNVIKLAIQCMLLAAFYVYFILKGSPARPSFYALAFPLLVLWIGALGCSLGLIISSLTTKYRDLVHLLNFGIQLLMYATPVVYPLSEAPKKFYWIFYLNPMSAPMEIFRIWFYRAGTLPHNMLFISLGITVVSIVLGLILFTKNERTFVDVI